MTPLTLTSDVIALIVGLGRAPRLSVPGVLQGAAVVPHALVDERDLASLVRRSAAGRPAPVVIIIIVIVVVSSASVVVVVVVVIVVAASATSASAAEFRARNPKTGSP